MSSARRHREDEQCLTGWSWRDANWGMREIWQYNIGTWSMAARRKREVACETESVSRNCINEIERKKSGGNVLSVIMLAPHLTSLTLPVMHYMSHVIHYYFLSRIPALKLIASRNKMRLLSHLCSSYAHINALKLSLSFKAMKIKSSRQPSYILRRRHAGIIFAKSVLYNS